MMWTGIFCFCFVALVAYALIMRDHATAQKAKLELLMDLLDQFKAMRCQDPTIEDIEHQTWFRFQMSLENIAKKHKLEWLVRKEQK